MNLETFFVGIAVAIATLGLFWFALIRQDKLWDKYMNRDDDGNGGIRR